MAGKIVVFGATGYTGDLVARSLVGRGERPLLAARTRERVEALAKELGGLDSAVADVSKPESVRALVERGDVLVSTVGPFSSYGDSASQAAIASGANYLDSTGEPSFIRSVFERFGPGAEAAGCGLVTAFGYDWVPGNLAAALALREAGEAAVRVEVAYYHTGKAGMSGGTQASAAAAFLEPNFAWRGGRLVTEPGGRRVKSFDVHGKRRQALSAGSSEHFALPKLYPQLREVDVYLGWFGPASRPLAAFSLGMSLATRVPGVRPGIEAALGRVVKGSTGGPTPEQRAQWGSYMCAAAYGVGGERLSEVRVEGVDSYDFTGDLLAWGAQRAAADGMRATGALGPVEAFGLDELEAGVAEAGIKRI